MTDLQKLLKARQALAQKIEEGKKAFEQIAGTPLIDVECKFAKHTYHSIIDSSTLLDVKATTVYTDENGRQETITT